MTKSHFWYRIQTFVMALLIGIVPLSGFSMAHARSAPKPALQTQPVTLVIDGIVQSINGEIWIVSGVTIHVTAQALITGYPVVGSTVHIVAITDGSNQIVAQSIALIPGTPTPLISATPSDTPTIAPTSTAGPSPTPTLSATPGTLVPTVMPTVTPGTTPTPIPYATIIIEGPVESINLNIIVVYGQRIKLRSDDPILAKLKHGDWVRVSGNYGLDDDKVTVVVIVVVIVIVDAPTTIIVVPPSNNDNNGDDNGKKHKGDDDEGD